MCWAGTLTGRTLIQLAVDDHILERLMGFDTDAAELEDGADAEPDADYEDDWLPVVLLDLARPKGHQTQADLGPGVRSDRLSHGT
jgi:hypothetical protein